MMQSLFEIMRDTPMMAYLVNMTARLIPLKRVLKETGSIYLHCDPTASHYLKMIMDVVFGKQNFRNEIIWSYKRYTAASNRFQKLHDVILFLGKEVRLHSHSPEMNMVRILVLQIHTTDRMRKDVGIVGRKGKVRIHIKFTYRRAEDLEMSGKYLR